MLRTIIGYVLEFLDALMGTICTVILLVTCIAGLMPVVFIFGGIEAVLLAVKDDKLPFEY